MKNFKYLFNSVEDINSLSFGKVLSDTVTEFESVPDSYFSVTGGKLLCDYEKTLLLGDNIERGTVIILPLLSSRDRKVGVSFFNPKSFLDKVAHDRFVFDLSLSFRNDLANTNYYGRVHMDWDSGSFVESGRLSVGSNSGFSFTESDHLDVEFQEYNELEIKFTDKKLTVKFQGMQTLEIEEKIVNNGNIFVYVKTYFTMASETDSYAVIDRIDGLALNSGMKKRVNVPPANFLEPLDYHETTLFLPVNELEEEGVIKHIGNNFFQVVKDKDVQPYNSRPYRLEVGNRLVVIRNYGIQDHYLPFKFIME